MGVRAEVYVDAREQVGIIDRNVYGHFIEHLGRCIYGGVWVGEGSGIPNMRGFRRDVLEAVKAIRPPVLRWPGGNFASGYHWEDGIGRRDMRPVRYDLAWEAVEPNQFGTHEFIEFCRLVGAEPYICVNTGSGTAEEAARWVEYCNRVDVSHYASLRAANGQGEPFRVKYWGIGNEVYGSWQIGHVDAGTYAKQVVEFAKLMRRVDHGLKLVAVGCESEEWNHEVLRKSHEAIDYISLHKYYSYEDTLTIVATPLEAERSLRHLAGLIDATVPARRAGTVKIAFDEWNVWYPEARAETGLTEKLTLRDGLFAAGMFHVFHRLCNHVTMANLAQLVNVLPAIVTSETGIYVNPVYLAFQLYVNHSSEVALRTRTSVETYEAAKLSLSQVPLLDCSATADHNLSRLYLAGVNRSEAEDIETLVELRGVTPANHAAAHELNARSATSANDFDRPDDVQVRVKSVEGVAERFTYVFPAHSATILAIP